MARIRRQDLYDDNRDRRNSGGKPTVEQKARQVKKRPNPFWSNLRSLIIFVIACSLAAVAAFELYLSSLTPIKNLESFKPNIVTQFYSHDGQIIKTFTAYSSEKIDITDVPEDLIHAIIATEDKNFYSHHGYDLTGLARSTVQNVIAGHVVQGASTITQQLARILFLSNEKTFDRKIKEIIIASRIEKTIPKDKILEMYLNNVYLGSGAYGVESAAKTYFNKSLNKCTLSELALIAGLPQAPSVYSPFNNKKLAQQRRNQVLLRMYKMHYITKEQYEKEKETPVKLTSVPKFYTTNKAPYFTDYVMNELAKMGFDETDISQGGYKIITTLDYKTQEKLNEAILKNMRAYGLTKKNHQAAVFSFSPIDGRIIAYAGGKDYTESQYDRVQAIRPAGSAFKPFVYATALEHDMSPNDLIEDKPITIGDWSPKNYGSNYRGKIPMYMALTISSNVCAVRLIQMVGIRAVIQTARTLGITTPLEFDYTIALGSNGSKLFELTRAYGAFANGGYVVQPFAIERIETSRGKVVYRAPKAKASRQLSMKTAAEMTAMLKSVVKHGTGRGADIGVPCAGKTGTTDNYKDASFVGYTPTVVTGVWVGNDDNTTTKSIQGGNVPARIWHDVMITAVEQFGKSDFNYPEIELKASGASKQEDENADETPAETNETGGQVTSAPVEHITPATNPKEAIQNFKKQQEHQHQTTAPVPANPAPTPAAPAPAPATTAPIPMAVPESVR
ncbi:PBP1A family penicillin-binding protein [bacterium]|nr:PBP1A family penicillin-binding protein [bacterium]